MEGISDGFSLVYITSSGITIITGPRSHVPMQPVSVTNTWSARLLSFKDFSKASLTVWQLEETQPAPEQTRIRY